MMPEPTDPRAIEWVTVPVPGSSGAPADAPPDKKSNPIDDTIKVSRTRIANPGRPRPVIESPHAHGDGAMRPWAKWAVESLTVPRNQLYNRIPGVVTLHDGTLAVEWWAGWPISSAAGDAFESMSKRVKTMAAFPGLRGAAFHTGACTMLPIPRAASSAATLPGTYWSVVHADGWMTHLFPDGELRTICGPQSRVDGQWPGAMGSGRISIGDFDTAWDLTNDLTLHPHDVGSHLVCDAANHRIARARHTAPGPGHVEIRTWAPTFPFPYSIDTVGDTVVVGDLDTGELTLLDAHDPTDRRVLARIPAGVASVRRTSTGTLTVMEQEGAQRLLEVATDGSTRTIWTAPTDGSINRLYYRQHDTDCTGAIGPVDDTLVSFWASTGTTLYRISLDGSYRSLLGQQGAGSKGGRQRQGSIEYVIDVLGHYPGWVRISREFCEFAVTAGASAGVFLFRRARPGEPNGWTQAQATSSGAGYEAWKRGTVAGGPLRPSFWPEQGWEGFHYTGPSPRDATGVPLLTEGLVGLGDEGLLQWLRNGGRGETPRPEITLQMAKDIRQRMRFADDRALTEGCTPPAGTDPPPEPADVTGPDLRIYGVPAVASEDFTLEVEATDPSGVASVAAALDGASLGTETTAPYRWEIDVDPLTVATHTITVTGVDTRGNSRVSVVTFTKVAPPAPDVRIELAAGVTYEITGGQPAATDTGWPWLRRRAEPV